MDALHLALSRLLADHDGDADVTVDCDIVASSTSLLDRLADFALEKMPEGTDPAEWCRRHGTWLTIAPEVVRLARGS